MSFIQKICLSIFIFLLNLIFFLVDLSYETYKSFFEISCKNLQQKPKAEVIRRDDNSITYRNLSPLSLQHKILNDRNIDTLDKLLEYVAFKYPFKRCLGTRIILEEKEEMRGETVLQKYNLGNYKWINFRDIDKAAQAFGRGLRRFGHAPHSKVAIFAETRAEWMVAAHGCFKEAMTIVTVYATLGDDGIAYCLNQTEVTTVITSYSLLPKLEQLLEKCPQLRMIIFMEDQLKSSDVKDFNENVAIVPFGEVLSLGMHWSAHKVYPKSSDVAIIMYTSGSTGTPKGVLLSHSNCISTIKGVCDTFSFEASDLFLGFLPLAHVFEFLAENVALLNGIGIGYSSAATITRNSAKVMKGCEGDAAILKPTLMTSVPLVLDRIVKAINDKIHTFSPFKQALITSCYNYRIKWLRKGHNTPLLNLLIFKKMKQLLGGQMRVIISGGAPLTLATLEQIETYLDVKLIQGYGLTETTSGATIMDINDRKKDRIGSPLTICDLRLVDWEEGNYCVMDKPYPRGEILIGGGNVALGYYKLPPTDEFFMDDGKKWFRTGDIGQMYHDGVCQIIDRKKDILKLQWGEYVSLGKIEAVYRTSPLVDNICVYGDSTKTFLVALVVPNEANLFKFVEESLNRTENSLEKCCIKRDVTELMNNEMTNFGKQNNLNKTEIPKYITLIADQWLPGSDLVTAAFKLRRKEIKAKYLADINRMYSI